MIVQTIMKMEDGATDLPGIWVGKYESSLVKKADSSNINTSSVTVGDIIVDSSNNTDRAIAVQPRYEFLEML